MRQIININENWTFIKENNAERVNLPHCWNAVDGQEGSNYYRGECVYEREIPPTSGVTFVEFNGANSVAKVFVNGRQVGTHRGGYSAFRFEITDYLTGSDDKLRVCVDNRDFEDVYPSKADFTFYGGLYRDANLITGLCDCRFSLTEGSCGVLAAPVVSDGKGVVNIRAFVDGAREDIPLRYALYDAEGRPVCEKTVGSAAAHASIEIDDPVLWDGLRNPYLYTLVCQLGKEEALLDEVSTRIGFRSVEFDAEKGCFLNGRHIKLKGVSRHQDRYHMGNALTEKEHREDIAMILEAGANSVRLAHYQQDRKFYDLCDETGLLVWAEVPVISQFSRKKQANAISQLTELITQNYNHPSIYCWGVQNEITMSGKAKAAEEGVRALNRLAKALDPLRPTTSAQLMMCGADSPMNSITDLQGYNHYFGWYAQTCGEIDKWLDAFHERRPEVKLCLSEYGAEGIVAYQTDKPVQGDYSEAYQAVFHEHYLRAIEEREWLYGSYVWNMFDFGAANRDEGGVKGRNNKGLVTIDRKTRKDSFYVYKAFWSDEKFVRIGGERYVDRPIGVTTVKVYSNLPEITLEANGKSETAPCDRVAAFTIEIKSGVNQVTAIAGGLSHTVVFNGVEEENPAYKLGAEHKSFVRNWFDASDTPDPDAYSIDDKIGVLLRCGEVQSMLKMFLGDKKISPSLLKLVSGFKVRTLIKLMRVDPSLYSIANNYLQTIKRI